MRHTIQLFLLLNIGLLAREEGIIPKQLKVDLPKKCQVLMLHVAPDRKSKKIVTHASVGDMVENMGCIREITQKELDALPEEKRYYIAWKYPVWCKVAVGKKKGWVLDQYLKNEDLLDADNHP